MQRRNPFIEPCHPSPRDRPPKGDGWVHEVKFDGYRIQLHKVAGEAAIYSRNGAHFTSRFPTIAYALPALPVRSVILDGELVAHNAKGLPAFDDLHCRRAPPEDLAVWVFDILEIDGTDLRHFSQTTRRGRLERLIERADHPSLRLSETFADPERLLAACNERCLEGIVSKRIDRPYTSGRTKNWIKVKCPGWKEATGSGSKCSKNGRSPCPPPAIPSPVSWRRLAGDRR